MPNPVDTVAILVPIVLRDRLASLRLHPRQPYYEVVEEALEFWSAAGGWAPVQAAPVDDARSMGASRRRFRRGTSAVR
jgi:hypothetical protein